MNDDVLEESERSSIRGTLLGIASRIHVGSQNLTDEAIDPYMREFRLWVKPRMSCEELQQVVFVKLGLKPSHIESHSKLYFRTPHCAYNSICVCRDDNGGWVFSPVLTTE